MTKKITLLLIAFLASCLTMQAQNWAQLGADIDGESTEDWSGWSVSLSADGSTVAIGAILNSESAAGAGHVRVFHNQNGTWAQIGLDIEGEAAGDNSGCTVSLSSDGTVLAVGAVENDGNGNNSGHVRIYKNISGTWTKIGADIDGEAAGDQSGCAVSLNSNGSIVAIGATLNDGSGSNAGHVRIYENQNGTWTQIGIDIDGEAAGDNFGYSVSLNTDGTIIAIGANKNSGNGAAAGHVRVYQNLSGTWTQIGTDIDGEAAGDQSGYSISLSSNGSILAIGASDNDGNGINSGQVRIYENLNGTWTQIGIDIDGEAAYDYSGYSVSLSANGSIVAIGAVENEENVVEAGQVRIYKNVSGTWTQIGADINGEADGDYSGSSVSLSSDGSVVAIGAIWNDGNGIDAGHVRVYKLTPQPTITTQPTNKTNICPNADISFAIVGTDIDSYQWQVNEGSNFTNILNTGVYSNATTATLNITGVTLAMNNYQYRCIISNPSGNLTSDSAALTIDNTIPEIVCKENQTVDANQTHFYTVQSTEFDPIETSDNCEVATVLNNINGLGTLAGATLAEGETHTITWTITDNAGNTNNCSFNVIVNTYVGIDAFQENGISIFPNPTKEKITIHSKQLSINYLQILDIRGKIIFNDQLSTKHYEIDLSNLEKGIYIVKIHTDKEVLTSKIIKE